MRKLFLLFTTSFLSFSSFAQIEIAPGPILLNQDTNNVTVFELPGQGGIANMEATAYQRWFNGVTMRNTTDIFAARHTGGEVLNEGDSWFDFVVESGLNPVNLDQITFYVQANFTSVWRVEARPTSSDPWVTVSTVNFSFADQSATELNPTVVPLNSSGNDGKGYREYRLILAETWTVPNSNFDLIGEVEFRATTRNMSTLSTEDFELANSTKIYPNPASDVLNIDSSDINITSVSLKNTLGKTVYINNTSNVDTIDVSGLPSGFYLLEITSSTGSTATKKVIVN